MSVSIAFATDRLAWMVDPQSNNDHFVPYFKGIFDGFDLTADANGFNIPTGALRAIFHKHLKAAMAERIPENELNDVFNIKGFVFPQLVGFPN
jgi:hypothetical protein